MAVSLQNKSCLIYDFGLFVELAITLSKSFGKVYYFCPWASAFPSTNIYSVGIGIDGVEKVDNFWDYIDEVDLFIFPDVYMGDLQVYLESIGKRVFGSRRGEEMELDRVAMKDMMKTHGLSVNDYEVITGMDNLKKYLKDVKDKYVKISRFRASFETFRHDNYSLSEPKLEEIEHTMGAYKNICDFIVEDALDDCVEIGLDCYTADGIFPSKTLAGIEIKDIGYYGNIREYDKLPKEITDFDKKMKSVLNNYNYRGFYSSEMRVTRNHESYMIDLAARAGSPPNELYQYMYKNIAEIIWECSGGNIVDPVTEHKYGMEVLIHSSWADKNWQAVEFDPKYRENIKFRNLAVIGGKYYCAPQYVGLPEIGAIVAEGDTPEEAIDKIKEIAETVKGYYIEVKLDSIDKALEEAAKVEEFRRQADNLVAAADPRHPHPIQSSSGQAGTIGRNPGKLAN